MDNTKLKIEIEDLKKKIKAYEIKMSIISEIISKREEPSFKRKNMVEKSKKAKHLISIGYSVREAMRIMNYKSPKSIQDLLKK